MNSDFTEQYLNEIYENIMREHTRLLNDMKNISTEMEKTKERDITKQLSILNTLMTYLLKLRNLKKDIKMKKDL